MAFRVREVSGRVTLKRRLKTSYWWSHSRDTRLSTFSWGQTSGPVGPEEWVIGNPKSGVCVNDYGRPGQWHDRDLSLSPRLRLETPKGRTVVKRLRRLWSTHRIWVRIRLTLMDLHRSLRCPNSRVRVVGRGWSLRSMSQPRGPMGVKTGGTDVWVPPRVLGTGSKSLNDLVECLKFFRKMNPNVQYFSCLFLYVTVSCSPHHPVHRRYGRDTYGGRVVVLRKWLGLERLGRWILKNCLKVSHPY